MKQTRFSKRIMALALAWALLLTLLPASSLAAEDAKQYGYVVIRNDSTPREVNVRPTPGSSDYVTRVAEFQVLEILGDTTVGQDDWYNITVVYTQDTGYIMADYVKLMSADEQAAWIEAGSPIYYSQPAADAEALSLTAEEADVAEEAVLLLAAAEDTGAETVEEAAADPNRVVLNADMQFLGPQEDAVQTLSLSANILSTQNSVVTESMILGYLRVVANGVSLHQGPEGAVISNSGLIPLNTELPYYNLINMNGYGWAMVQYNGLTGYIRSDCYALLNSAAQATPVPSQTVAPAAPTAAPNATPTMAPGLTYGYVNLDDTFFRTAATTRGGYWAKLPKGWTMEVLGWERIGNVTWYQVRSTLPNNPGQTYVGYIHGEFFTVISNTAAPTEVPTASNYALVTLDGINLRQTPGGVTIYALQSGIVLNIVSAPSGYSANDWYFVERQGVYGYLPATAVRVLNTSELGNYVLPNPITTEAPTQAPLSGSGYVKLILDKVNLRKTPGGTILTPKETDKLPKGAVLAYTAGPVSAAMNNKNFDWVLVTYNGVTGYVRSDCYQYCDRNGNAVVITTPAPTALPTIYPGYPTAGPTNSPFGQGYIKLIRNDVNLRKTPGGDVIRQLPKGTVLPYYNIAYQGTESWYEVYYPATGEFGYIMRSMAETTDEYGNSTAPGALPSDTPVTVIGYVITTASSVWLRKTPNANAETLGQVKEKGTVLPQIGPSVKDTNYEWFPVETTDGTRAYLRGDFVKTLAQWQLDEYNRTGVIPTATPGPATPRPGNSNYIQTTADKLWVRQTPSKQAATMGQLPIGAIVQFYQTRVVANVIWYQVMVNGLAGWVHGDYVRILSNAEYDALMGTASPAPTSSPIPSIDLTQLGTTAVTTEEKVRIRADASLNSRELAMVYTKGTYLTYLGQYKEPTQANPHYWYYVRYNNVTGWMCGDFVRVLTKAEESGQTTGPSVTPTPAPGTYRTLYKNSTGEDVLRLQQRLAVLGYLASDQVTGVYLSSTEAAVIAFQRARGLTVDGIAGTATQHALFDGTDTGNIDYSGSVDTTLYPVEKSDWYSGDIQSIWKVGSVAVITDVYTGISFRAQRLYGSNHADCEPLTTADTAAICQIYGVARPQEIEDREQELQSWRRRPLWVTIGGRTFCASMYGIPHNFDGDVISDNGYNGQFCVHFVNSRTHTTNVVDVDADYNGYFGHQSAIQYAYEHSISGWK